MFIVRRTDAGDRDEVAELVVARADWLREHGFECWRGWREFAEEYGQQAADPAFPVWVLARDDRIVGATCLYEESPAWFWTPAERAEPAFFVASTVTDPAMYGKGLGYLLMRWVLDHGACRFPKSCARLSWAFGDLCRGL